MADQDDRGFQKTGMEVMNPREANFQDTGKQASKRLEEIGKWNDNNCDHKSKFVCQKFA